MERQSTLIKGVKSISDVVTNSSDEVFAVKTDLPIEEIRTMWNTYMMEIGEEEYGTPSNPKWMGIYDSIIRRDSERPDEVIIEYPILCNVDDFRKRLEELFGEDNVIDFLH